MTEQTLQGGLLHEDLETDPEILEVVEKMDYLGNLECTEEAKARLLYKINIPGW